MSKSKFGSRVFALVVFLLLSGLPVALAHGKTEAAADSKADALVDLNSATATQLKELPGVGDATAKKIIAGRPYASIDDLSKAGIKAATIEKLRSLVTVGALAEAPDASSSTKSPAPKSTAKPKAEPDDSSPGTGKNVDLNTATNAELKELPGVGEATAKKIIAGRPYASIDDLAKAGIKATEIEKLRPLVSAGASAEAPEATSSTKSPAAKPTAKPKTESDDSSVATGKSVDLNSATDAELKELPGVGVATAKKIIAGRPYASVDDLAKTGIKAAEIEKLRPLVTIGVATDASATVSPEKTAPDKKTPDKPKVADAEKTEPNDSPSAKEKPQAASSELVDLNTATTSQLKALPGIGDAYAAKIIAARPFESVDGLSKTGIPAATLAKVKTLVVVKAAETEKPAVEAKTPPQPGMVWANSTSKFYHKEGSRWYGKTKKGEWMTEQDALKAGYRAAKN